MGRRRTTEQQIATLREAIGHFVEQRGWAENDSPKNLAIAVSVEAAELLELFQWVDRPTGKGALRNVGLEMADVLIYLLRLSDVLGIDLMRAAAEKMDINRARFPKAGSGRRQSGASDAE